MTTLREDDAAELAADMFPLIQRYADEHGASSTIVDGLYALAHVAAYLLCSRGVDTEIAKGGFIALLDHCIETCPFDEDVTLQ